MWPSESPFFPLARRSDTPTHTTARARKEPTGSTPKAGSCQTAKDDGGKPGVRFLARSKRGTRFRLRRSSVERNKEGDGFARLRWGETKEGDAVGGASLTIEIGPEFPIGITDPSLGRIRMIDVPMRPSILAQPLPFRPFGVQTPGSREMTLVSASPACLASRMTISTSRPRAFRNRNNRSVEKPSSLPRMRAEILGWSMPRRLAAFV